MSDWYIKALEWAGIMGAGGIASHFLTKRKYTAETDGEVIKNFKEAIHEWKELREVYKSEILENRKEIDRLRELIRNNQIECDNTNRILSERIAALEREISEDKKLIETLNEKLKSVETNP